jgi:hypothetical protein
VPPVYQKAFEYISSDLGLSRQFVTATAQPPADVRSQIDTRFFRHANVGRCNVMSLGADFPEVLNDFESQAEPEQALVCQFFINLQQPWVGSTVDLLRSRGYGLGGYLPRWFDTDGLLMQKLKHPPAFDAIKLLTDRARGLLQLVREDWEQTHL